MIAATRRGLCVTGTDADIARIRETFDARHIVRLQGFFGADLLAQFQERLPHASFSRRIEQDLEIERTLEEPALVGLAMFALNDPALFDLVDRLTGCGPIGCFSGRVHQRAASVNGSHYFPWHTDAVQQRLVGLTINLSDERFEGGVLQIRRRRSKAIMAEAETPARGDALLFRISKDLEHHVTPVTTNASRLVLAGWFRRSPDFWQKARCVSS